ncbi:MAG: response regulator [Vicinamibacterales bacterium]|nr:response regulator [Vicinamibacterales bacterium]
MTRVLIVDDSPSVLRILQFVFESAQYAVTTATDGAEGLQKIGEQLPDVVVTDSIMPGMDGFAFVRKLKEQPDTRAIPVIMLTSEEPTESLSPDSAPHAFVKKSADFAPLLNKVSEALAAR